MGNSAATSSPGAAVDLTEAHRRLVADKSLQFDFGQAPPPPKPPPNWLSELLAAIAPFLQFVFWALVALAALLIVGFIVRELVKVRWSGRAKTDKRGPVEPPAWRPEAARARLLLAQADELAAQGLFAEAAHHLLLHSVQDIEDHRPRAIRPALTSRDIAALDTIPAEPRAAFARIARIVEESLFGGRDLDAARFAETRAAYEAFALAGAWR